MDGDLVQNIVAMPIDTVKSFFSNHRSDNSTENKLADYLHRQNAQYNFVPATVRQIGFPYWENLMKVSSPIEKIQSDGNSSKPTGGDSVHVYFIPFVRPGANVVNATMIVKTTKKDTSFRYITNTQYKDSVSTGLKGRDQSLLLMKLDKNVFGDRTYKITDSAAFGHNEKKKAIKYVKLGIPENKSDIKGDKLAPIVFYECYTIWIPANQGQVVGCPPDGPCDQYVQDYVCISGVIWADVEENGGSSGGGGGSGSTLPPENGGVPATSGTPSTGGWYPTEPPQEPRWPSEGNGLGEKDANGYYISRKIWLLFKLEQDPFMLLPCDSLTLMNLQTFGPMYKNVAQHAIPADVSTRMDQIRSTSTYSFFNYYVQHLAYAQGDVVNCDFFPLKITQLPFKPFSNNRHTPAEFLEYFRLSINNFISPHVGVKFDCEFKDAIVGNTLFTDCAKFNSPYQQSIGSLWHLGITAIPGTSITDDGTIVISDYNIQSFADGHIDHYFTVSTIATPYDNEHPVSGNRRFGIYSTPEKPYEYTFYTMGVDRPSDVLGNQIWRTVLEGGDKLWTNVMGNMANTLNNPVSGGAASYYSQKNYIARPYWDSVEKYLRGEISSQQMLIKVQCP